eukprot:657343-Amphidinium_carterae.1
MVRVSVPLKKERTMLTRRKTGNTIQDNNSAPYREEPLRQPYVTAEGAYALKKNELYTTEELYMENMPCEKAREQNRGK